MDPSFSKANKCTVAEVEQQIQQLTDKHAKADEFISSKAIYIRVVRSEGPQLSLIDLPGVTHNADQMENIHEVTVKLVEEYIKAEEMVILCVIPAMSDFGNAEVVKLARKYDPEGDRTLGVVTKCDDAAKAEASDIVEKVLMTRPSDVRLEMGFHCVVNRSQKNIEESMSREALWVKEKNIFTNEDRMKRLPKENWGTLRLMEKVAKIQEARVDGCLPKIKEDVRKKIQELHQELRSLPAQPENETDRSRIFNSILSRIRNDLERRIRAEFMSANRADRELTIAPKVASMVQEFRKELLEQNPHWLEEDMIEEVDDAVRTFVTGYTVDNLTGPHVFTNLIKQTFLEEGLLKGSVRELVMDVAAHLRKVVKHVIEVHADINGTICNDLDDKAEECIDQLNVKALDVCEMLADAQQITSTTQGQYMVKLTDFRKLLMQDGDEEEEDLTRALSVAEWHGEKEEKLPAEFKRLVKQAQDEPQRFATLEICASLHVYTRFMIEGFVEMSAKLVKFNMVEQLADKLEEVWREELGGNLEKLFPKDEKVIKKKHDLAKKIEELSGFKDELMSLRPALPPVRRKQTLKERARARGDAKAEEAAARTFIWDFANDIEGKTVKRGKNIRSEKFTLLDVPDLQLSLYPKGDTKASKGFMSLYIDAPTGWQLSYKLTLGDTVKSAEMNMFEESALGWHDFAPGNDSCTKISFELLEATPPQRA
eukprot:Skav201411  [mRNA]  locus=scaffold83:75572:77704:+ [translate_table: standard]